MTQRKSKASPTSDTLTAQERKIERLEMEIADLKRQVSFFESEAGHFKRLYKEAHFKFVGALISIKTITSDGEPDPREIN